MRLYLLGTLFLFFVYTPSYGASKCEQMFAKWKLKPGTEKCQWRCKKSFVESPHLGCASFCKSLCKEDQSSYITKIQTEGLNTLSSKEFDAYLTTDAKTGYLVLKEYKTLEGLSLNQVFFLGTFQAANKAEKESLFEFIRAYSSTFQKKSDREVFLTNAQGGLLQWLVDDDLSNEELKKRAF